MSNSSGFITLLNACHEVKGQTSVWYKRFLWVTPYLLKIYCFIKLTISMTSGSILRAILWSLSLLMKGEMNEFLV